METDHSRILRLEHWRLMTAMLNTAGVDLASEYLDGNLTRFDLHEALATCMKCSHVADCERFLEVQGNKLSGIPGYCLNRPLIERLQA